MVCAGLCITELCLVSSRVHSCYAMEKEIRYSDQHHLQLWAVYALTHTHTYTQTQTQLLKTQDVMNVVIHITVSNMPLF